MLRVSHSAFGVLQPVLSGYLLGVTTLAVPMALVSGLWWLAGYCALMGMVFARILLEQVRGWRLARNIAGRVDEAEPEWSV